MSTPVMHPGPLSKAIRRTLVRLTGGGAADGDGALLQRFVGGQDEAAFEALVRRHGPMVLAVGRRVTADAQLAEDVFQATFVVLLKKAAALTGYACVGGWLHTVAYRIALRARAGQGRRQARERSLEGTPLHAELPQPNATSGAGPEVRAVLDEELGHLPEKYRTPVVLCYLEGRTSEDVARQLHCTSSAIRMRLQRACGLLRGRLAQRGLVLSEAALAAVLAQEAAAGALSPQLVAAVLAAASGEAVSATAAPLAQATLTSMAGPKLRLVVGVLLGACTLAGFGLYNGPAGFGTGQEDPSGALAARADSADLQFPEVEELMAHEAFAPGPQPKETDMRLATIVAGGVVAALLAGGELSTAQAQVAAGRSFISNPVVGTAGLTFGGGIGVMGFAGTSGYVRGYPPAPAPVYLAAGYRIYENKLWGGAKSYAYDGVATMRLVTVGWFCPNAPAGAPLAGSPGTVPVLILCTTKPEGTAVRGTVSCFTLTNGVVGKLVFQISRLGKLESWPAGI